jgi:hypothetical protein
VCVCDTYKVGGQAWLLGHQGQIIKTEYIAWK